MKQNRVPKRLWLHLEHASLGMSGRGAEDARALGLTSWVDPEILIRRCRSRKASLVAFLLGFLPAVTKGEETHLQARNRARRISVTKAEG